MSDSDSEKLDLANVLADELQTTKGRSAPRKDLDGVFRKLYEAQLTALCFSGGGIRSATFGLGVVQALAKYNLLSKFDYLSTVSGGGYLGSWLSAWICRERARNPGDNSRESGVKEVEKIINCQLSLKPDNPNPEPTQLQHLREYSNYMSPKVGLLSADSWSLGAIYARNLFLNLTIFIPLMAAVLMLPRFLFRVTMQDAVGPTTELTFLFLALVAGSWAIAFVISRLPSKTTNESMPDSATRRRRFAAFLNTDAGILLFGVLPLVLSAFLLSSLRAWIRRSAADLSTLEALQLRSLAWMDQTLFYFIVGCAAAYVLGLAVFLAIRFRQAHRDISAGVAALVASFLGGLLLWVVSQRMLSYALGWLARDVLGEERSARYIWEIYQTFSVPLFLLIVLIAATAFVGFTSRTATDEDREWLARYGGWVLIVCGVWVVLNGLVLFGPSFLQWLARFEWKNVLTDGLPAVISTVTAIASGVVALRGGYSEKSLVRDEPVKTKTSRFLAFAPKLAAVVFLAFIFVVIAYITTLLLSYFITGSFGAYHWVVLAEASARLLVITFLSLATIGLVMACFVNVNKFSLHGAYRDRLVRAYLGASNANRKQNTFTGFDDNDNLELKDLGDQKPLHVINAAVNLVGGRNLAWQNRKAASFTMSALHCGSWAVKGYRRSEAYCKSTREPRRALRLGTAMAISGAAANPNMGYYSSSVVTFLMSLFNIRLGWWLGNTGDPGSDYDWFGKGRYRYFEKVGPSIAILPLLNETLGRTDETKRFLNVSDGGHFENLALYEMILRRCRLIILSDGAADRAFKFGEIANAIQKCKVDLGVDIRFLGAMNIVARSIKEDPAVKRSRFAIAEITYPENRKDKGYLIYTRPAYYRNEPADVRNYAECNDAFPHQSTGDQMYDEKQFEAYRGLGFFTMEEIIKRLRPGSKSADLIDEEFDDLLGEKKDLEQTLDWFFRDANSLSGQWAADQIKAS